MERLTLDTSILRDWAWCENLSLEKRYPSEPQKRDELSDKFTLLTQLTQQGKCELGVSNQIYTDYGEDILPEHISKLIKMYITDFSSISTFPMTFPFTFIEDSQIDEAFSLVFPQSKPGDKQYEGNRKDAMQLLAHKTAGRDFFITADNEILRARSKLEEKFGIRVLTLSEYLSAGKN